MERKFYQTEGGNATVLALDGTIILWVEGTSSLLLTNPAAPKQFESGIKTVEVSQGDTPAQIKAKIDAVTGIDKKRAKNSRKTTC